MQEVWGSNPHSSTQGQRKFSNSSYRLLPALVARWVAEVDQQAFGLAPVDEAVAIKAGVAGPGLSECWRGRTAAFTPTLCGPPAQAGRSYLSRFLQGTGEARYLSRCGILPPLGACSVWALVTRAGRRRSRPRRGSLVLRSSRGGSPG